MRIILGTYFASVAEHVALLNSLPISGVHIDCVRAPEQLAVFVEKLGSDKILSAGVIDGRNVWRANLRQVIANLQAAKAKFGNPNLKLRPGDYARVKVEGFVQTNGVKIPQSALGQELSNSIVYVVDQNSSVAKKIVQVSSEDGAGAVISGGLDNGDKVILDNFKKIRVGAPVKVNQGKK